MDIHSDTPESQRANAKMRKGMKRPSDGKKWPVASAKNSALKARTGGMKKLKVQDNNTRNLPVNELD